MKKFIKWLLLVVIIVLSYCLLDVISRRTGDHIAHQYELTHQPTAEQTAQETVETPESLSETLPATDEFGREMVIVLEVVDGDTLFCKNSAGETFKVRLIGVDTPESVHADASRNVPEGKTASGFTKLLIQSGDAVALEYDASKYDIYARTLAYVYLNSGKMLQEVLLSSGMGRTMEILPCIRYSDRFALIEQEARQARAGFWGTVSDYFLQAD